MYTLQDIKTANIVPHPNNPRRDLGDLTELTDSIKKNGVMQNLTVVPGPEDGGYTVLIGHRRLAAALAAGLEKVPCRVAEGLSEKEQLGIMLEENMQRTDLTIVEQAKGFQMMLDLGETIKTVAEKTGFSETTVRHRVELAKIPEEQIDNAINKKQITIHDLFELEKIKDPEKRKDILDRATNGWQIQNSVRVELENEQIEQAKEIILPLLKAAGIKRKKGFQTWRSDQKEIRSFKLLDLPQKIDIKEPPKGQEYYWDIPYGENLFIYKIIKQKEDNSGLRKEQEERNRRRDALDQTYDEIVEQCRRFIVAMLKGNYKIKAKDELESWHELWDDVFHMLFDYYSYCSTEYMDVFDGEPETVEPDEVTPIERAVVVGWCALSDNSTVNWGGRYKDNVANAVKTLIKVLERAGFELQVNDADKLLDGTHEYYQEEDE